MRLVSSKEQTTQPNLIISRYYNTEDAIATLQKYQEVKENDDETKPHVQPRTSPDL
ncbi:MAG: hypothetical protein ICV55_04165 [Coleofasciculus sp. C3-bin4]|nr:hypothetical protein [Coleofasciculus sp. C3-bin4]